MFREMRRFKQQVSDAECIDILKSTKRGVLSVLGVDGFRKEGDWALNITSVITFGRIHLVEDEEVALMICSELTKKFTDEQAYLEKEIKNSFKNVQCLELVPEHMTGKLVNES